MSPILIGLIGIIILFVLMASGINVGIAMAVSGFLGLLYIMGFSQALSILGAAPYRTARPYPRMLGAGISKWWTGIRYF